MRHVHNICHCKNNKCKARKECYRWNAYQEVLNNKGKIFGTINVLVCDNKEKCEDFMVDDTHRKGGI